VGGPGPYLGLFARAGLSRATVDKAVADLGIHELPAARGRTYVLPAADFTLGLRVGEAEAEAGMAAVARDFVETGPRSRAGLTASIEAGTAIEAVSAAVVAVLEAADRPLDPAALEAATGEAVRNLGEAGREPGSATLLPLALARLQARGEILRMRTNGRLDQRRYRYVRWDRYTGGQSAEEAQAHLARRYFDWAAPASLTHFRWFSGLTSVAAEAAVAGLDLRLLPGTELLIPVGLAGRFARFEVPRRPWYALVADTDGIHLLHREFGLLLDEADAARPAPGDPGQGRWADWPIRPRT
jgi:hypothetical protein